MRGSVGEAGYVLSVLDLLCRERGTKEIPPWAPTRLHGPITIPDVPSCFHYREQGGDLRDLEHPFTWEGPGGGRE